MQWEAQGRLAEETRRIGEALLEEARQRSGVDPVQRLMGRLVRRLLADPAYKLQLFRFVDVLPVLDDDGIIDHLHAYFGAERDPLGGLIRGALSLGRYGGWPGRQIVARAVRSAATKMARTFITGERLSEILPVLRGLHDQRIGFTLDLLGEAVLSQSEAERYRTTYAGLLETLPRVTAQWPEQGRVDRAPWGAQPRAQLSMKLSTLCAQPEPAAHDATVAALAAELAPLLATARRAGAHLHVDMEEYHLKEVSLDAFMAAAGRGEAAGFAHTGIVVQSYLRESDADVQRLLAWLRRRPAPVSVRLVKGAYWDYEVAQAGLQHWPVPVFQAKEATDARFEALTRRLLAEPDRVHLALGSHNIRSIAHALAVARLQDLPPQSVEFQLLYGMARPLRDALVARGERVRIYAPFGDLIAGMAYLVRRLLENTANESFLRQSFMEDAPPAVLLAAPRPLDGEAGPGDPGDGPGEPHRDFARRAQRQAFAAALARVKGQLGDSYPLLIAGRAVDGAGTITSRDPSQPERVVGAVAAAGREEAARAVASAREAFPAWRDLGVEARAACLRRAAGLMRRRRDELAAWLVYEAGKPWREADADVAEAIDFLEYYSRRAEALMADRGLPSPPGERNAALSEPRGVTAVIAPWNFPLAILTGMVSAALVTGNPVIAKPASATPVIAYHLVRLLHAAGVPPAALHYLPGPGGAVGDLLVRHPEVVNVAFTGSLEVGQALNAVAHQPQTGQRRMKRVVAELGGKNAMIVDEDADLDEAVLGVATSAFGYAGQKCSACARAIVVGEIYTRFVERLAEAAASLVLGPAAAPETFVGPVIAGTARERIEAYIETGRQEARALSMPGVPAALAATGGHYVAPQIFIDVPREAVVAREEIFGPVLAVQRAASFRDAVAMALEPPQALTGGVYSRHPGHLQAAARQLRVGNLYLNRSITGARVGRQPFGGLGLSGVGHQAGGPDYLLQFVDRRTVTEQTLRRGFASQAFGVEDEEA